MPALVSDLIQAAAERNPDAIALRNQGHCRSYGDLHNDTRAFANGLLGLGLAKSERVAIYLEKRFEAVTGMFGAAAAGGVYVPVNPLLKAEQVAYILQDCNVRVLLTSNERLAQALGQVPAIVDQFQVLSVRLTLCQAVKGGEDLRTTADLTHDPRLDDMALLTALNSRAFYIGALGSQLNSRKRRENLALLGLGA
ncbi:MAG: AMP-binding protein, partial [Burkholderiales bacterium]